MAATLLSRAADEAAIVVAFPASKDPRPPLAQLAETSIAFASGAAAVEPSIGAGYLSAGRSLARAALLNASGMLLRSCYHLDTALV